MLTTAELDPRINKGFSFLNRKIGEDWPTQIDLAKLSMGMTERCILGQLFGTYQNAKPALYLDQYAAVDYGFDLQVEEVNSSQGPTNNYSALTEAWKNRIQEARDAASCPA